MGRRNPVELAESASSNRGIRALLGALVAALVAGAGFIVWRRSESKSQAPAEHKWAPPTASPAAFQSGMADVDSPDVVDDGFAAEVDAESAELAEEMLGAIDAAGDYETDPAHEPTQVEFHPGMADVDSPDVVDDGFAAQVDAEAEELAEQIVEAIEESDK